MHLHPTSFQLQMLAGDEYAKSRLGRCDPGRRTYREAKKIFLVDVKQLARSSAPDLRPKEYLKEIKRV